MRFTGKRIIALGLVASLAVAAFAYAYWTGSGSGTGTGTVGTTGSVTITGTVASGISPGANRSVSFKAANPSSSPAQVTTVHLEGVAVDTGHPGCTTGDFTMADVTETHQVPGNATVEVLPTNGSLAYAETGLNQDACKGATLTLTLSSS
jgi:hypothetical protein